MDRETRTIANRFAKLLQKQMNINQLILFGSRARGDHFVTSDFDFILVSDDFMKIPFTRRAAHIYGFWSVPQDIEVLCYTQDEWRRLKNNRGILLNAQENGIKIL
jgi:predicted nucleotidyltransferase